jgi:HPt (histidine-containing phosphotransfer) domain-containing protein
MLDKGPRQVSPQPFEVALARIRGKFIQSIPGRLAEIRSCFDDIENGRNALAGLHGIEAELHKIAGIAGSVGFPELGKSCGQTEADIAQFRKCDANAADVDTIVGDILTLTSELSQIVEDAQA